MGEKTERFNWDAPILVSPHNPQRLYFASQRVWKSENRGDSWTSISNDLTTNTERISTPFYGEKQKWDNAWDIYAMSNYSTITSLSESPIKEGLLYAGTDDGIIQVTEDGGNNWRKVDFSKVKELPNTAFVNDIKADLYDENVVYAVFDNHKYGDYNPYLFKSSDKGMTWVRISNNLPEKTLLWRIVQDHEDKNLMFLGTEFGIYITINGGKSWDKFKDGMPNISVRDIAIQKREDDLVAGTFGRGIYILDDYSSLRNLNLKEINSEAKLFKPRDGEWFVQKRILGGGKKAAQGDGYFVADNPPFGVEFTYYLKESYQSKKENRKKNEKEMEKNNQVVSVPDWNELDSEKNEIKPSVWLYIYNSNGNIVRKVKAKNSKGFNRVNWDFKKESNQTITPKNVERDNSGNLLPTGSYSAQLFKRINGSSLNISEKVEFKVEQRGASILKPMASFENTKYWDKVSELRIKVGDFSSNLNDTKKDIEMMLKAYYRATKTDESLLKDLLKARNEITAIDQSYSGSASRSEVGEKNEFPGIWSYLNNASSSSNTYYGPTETHRQSFDIAKKLYTELNLKLNRIEMTLDGFTNRLKSIGAPDIKR